jgi:ATP-dependent exoDNAse (exonuclease V) beta subunit
VDPRRIAEDLDDELIRSLPPAEREAARARAERLVERFLAGPLYARLRQIAADVVARELPVLLPPAAEGSDGPVGFRSGAVDLVYRDAETDALVVADYKTDRVASSEELDAKAALYASQGAGYVEAVQQALGLEEPPRFELWFLDADVIRSLDAG